MRTAVSSLSLLRPRSLRDALRLLRDEGPLTPLAGCTDVYVNLNFGTLATKRFIDLWPLDDLRRIRVENGRSDRSDRDLHGLIRYPLVAATAILAPTRARSEGPVPDRGTLGGNVSSLAGGDTIPCSPSRGDLVY